MELRYYFIIAWFRFRENFTDLRATFIVYLLYAFFTWLLSNIWVKYNSLASHFRHEDIILYVGITELLFMSFLNGKAIRQSTEDFALSLARPRSWILREIFSNIGMNLGKRLCFSMTLVGVAWLFKSWPSDGHLFLLRLLFVVAIMALPQALLSSVFSSLHLSFSQTEYMVLPFSKLFLALGGVFGPFSDYGEPWRSIFLKLPGSDLFFQPAYYVVFGRFYELTPLVWILRFLLINSVLSLLLIYFYRWGRRQFQAWGG